MITLFPDEKVVSEATDNSVVLTTHRICYEQKEWGKSYNQSIMLEHITSCENHYADNKALAFIGIACLALSAFSAQGHNNQALSTLALFAGIVLLLGYWLTRRSVIIISSPSTKMKISTTGMKRESILHFVNLVEQTKHQRVKNLSSRGQ